MTCPHTRFHDAENHECATVQGELQRRVAVHWSVRRDGAAGRVATSVTVFPARAEDNPDATGLNDAAAEPRTSYPPATLAGDEATFEATFWLRPGLHYRGAINVDAPEGCNVGGGNEIDIRTHFDFDVAPCRCEDDLPFDVKWRVVAGGADVTDVVRRGDCIEAADAEVEIVATPDQPIMWRSPASPIPGDPRRARVALPEPGAEADVRAEVGPPPCTMTVATKVRRCPAPPPKPPPWCPGPDWCPYWEAMWVFAFIFGHVALYIGTGVLVQGGVVAFIVRLIGAVVELIPQTSTVGAILAAIGNVGGFVVFLVFCFLAGVWLACLMAVAACLALWLLCCKPTPCRVAEDLWWAFLWTDVLCAIVSLIIPAPSGFLLLFIVIKYFFLVPYMSQKGCKFLVPWRLPHRR